MFSPKRLALLSLIAFGLFAAPISAQTITAIVAQSGGTFDTDNSDYDILLTAVLAAGLDDDLDDANANLTVFAPNDGAFIKLAQDLGYTGSDEAGAWPFLAQALADLNDGVDPIPVLTNVLLYHVAPGRISPLGLIIRTFFNIDINTLLPGATIDPFFFKLRDNDPDLKNPRVRNPLNINADNGKIHTINRVLIPIDIP
ncbi:MAG: fasciclin domain-containing protein [Planctomycetota bacterium]